jgi:hypothetical protein
MILRGTWGRPLMASLLVLSDDMAIVMRRMDLGPIRSSKTRKGIKKVLLAHGAPPQNSNH